MIQPPKRTKYRKMMKGRNRGKARNPSLAFGEFGLQAVGRGVLTPRQIEAARRAIARYIKRGGKIWIRIFPDKPITKKPLEVRMGSGKGSVEYYVFNTKPGTVIFEMSGVAREVAQEAYRLAAAKLPFACKMIERDQSPVEQEGVDHESVAA